MIKGAMFVFLVCIAIVTCRSYSLPKATSGQDLGQPLAGTDQTIFPSDRAGSCIDMSNSCGILASAKPGNCNTNPNVQWSCKKTCGLCGWKKVAVAHRTWDVNECSKLGEKKITGGIKHQGTACKGYCNDFRKWKISNGFRVMANKCNAINYNPRTDKCIAWACITPIPFPTVFLPGFEAYTREEEGTCFDGIKNQDEEDVDCGGETCWPCMMFKDW